MKIKITALVLLMVSSGCGLIKNMDEMHDSTVGMSKTTQKMSDTTAGMSETTDHMAETTDNLLDTAGSTYTDLRQGNSLTIRWQRLEAMNTAESMQSKISEASKFVMAFEFQLWKAFGADTAERRHVLYEDAVIEFFRSMAEWVPYDRDTAPTSNDNAMKNLYALATAVHKINPNQHLMIEEAGGLPEVSFLTVVKDGLSQRLPLARGQVRVSELPVYIQEVLKEEQNATYLLRLRHSFLAAMALSKVSDTESRGDISKFFRKLGIYLFKWTADFDGLNEVQIREYAKWLNEASATRDFLVSVGLESKLDKKIREIYENMRVTDKEFAKRQPGTPLTGRQEAILEFCKAVVKLLAK